MIPRNVSHSSWGQSCSLKAWCLQIPSSVQTLRAWQYWNVPCKTQHYHNALISCIYISKIKTWRQVHLWGAHTNHSYPCMRTWRSQEGLCPPELLQRGFLQRYTLQTQWHQDADSLQGHVPLCNSHLHTDQLSRTGLTKYTLWTLSNITICFHVSHLCGLQDFLGETSTPLAAVLPAVPMRSRWHGSVPSLLSIPSGGGLQ